MVKYAAQLEKSLFILFSVLVVSAVEYYKNSTNVGLNISAFSIGERKLC